MGSRNVLRPPSPRFVYIGSALATVAALLAAWNWLFVFFAMGFTWQATVSWCAYHRERDGRNVWERDDGPNQDPR